MIVWTGWGFLAGLIWLASLMLTQMAVDDLYSDPRYYATHGWPKVAASLIAAPVIWVVGRLMNGSPNRDERRALGAKHTLFFIPMEYWGAVFIGIGLLFLLLPSSK